MRKPARLLYVDDAELDRELVRLALQEAPRPYELVEVGSRDDFLGKLSQDFSLVITDLNVLGFSGLDVLQLVKREMPEVPVVILTGTGSEELAVQAMKMGATDYVIKNVRHMRRLPHTIEAILENEQLRCGQRRLAEVVSAIDDCYWIFQLKQNRFVYVSPAFERILGLPVSLAYEQPQALWRTLPAEEQERLRAWFATSLLGEIELTWPDAHIRKVRVRGRRLENRLVGSLQDLTPLREAPPTKRKPRVLVVEDNDAIRRLMVTLLRREGYEVVEAGNGEQVMQAPLEPVELLVTDFAMPGMTGVELAERLQPAKVLFTSGCSLAELERRGFQADTASFLPKPFSPIQLREKVHSLLD
ncbi:MAG: response regulator [Candidatus Eremiobacteraeota bacterium]|nr:response regulator [Candidatus Eremiobacteraeota bacterium]MCW5866451.1 response regulator [Candidatus Eremiobacteraeota bacterium]